MALEDTTSLPAEVTSHAVMVETTMRDSHPGDAAATRASKEEATMSVRSSREETTAAVLSRPEEGGTTVSRTAGEGVMVLGTPREGRVTVTAPLDSPMVPLVSLVLPFLLLLLELPARHHYYLVSAQFSSAHVAINPLASLVKTEISSQIRLPSTSPATNTVSISPLSSCCSNPGVFTVFYRQSFNFKFLFL